MSVSLVNKYIWLVNTIQAHGRITRERINELWCKSNLSNGTAIPRRTFINYRRGAEEFFNITIGYDASTFEYFIGSNSDTEGEERVKNWLLDSMAVNQMLSDATDITSKIIVEDIPSAREHLSIIIDSLKNQHRITFRYKSYTKSQPYKVVLEPYFLRLFKQLWYVVGKNVTDDKLKTYALDRMTGVICTDESYSIPDGFDGNEFYKDCFGMTTSKGVVKNIMIRVNPTQAKYFRALPLHHSQSEDIHDKYSIFYYRMFITYDLIQQLLSYGANIEVLQPAELRAAMIQRLQEALALYPTK